jgi:hypothetical protein
MYEHSFFLAIAVNLPVNQKTGQPRLKLEAPASAFFDN